MFTYPFSFYLGSLLPIIVNGLSPLSKLIAVKIYNPSINKKENPDWLNDEQNRLKE